MSNSTFFQNKPKNEDLKNSSQTTSESLWKVDDVAMFLRLTPGTVRMMARQSKIPSIKMGKHYRFRSADIQTWLDAQVHDTVLAQK